MSEPKNVLIIGASGEIGCEIVRKLLEMNCQFILHYHKNRKTIDQLTANINNNRILMTIQADLTSNDDLDRLVNSIPFRVDTIIFAQGQADYGLLTDTSIDKIDQLYLTHVKSTMLISKHFLPQMINNQSGNLIIISSIWGEVGASYEVAYSTMKGAQISFIKALAKEVGPNGVKVNGVSPGYISTKMNEALDVSDHEQLINSIPLKRAGTVQDVAHAVKFLCSEDASYINGQIIRIDGGLI